MSNLSLVGLDEDDEANDQGNQVSETEQDAQEGADDTPPDVLGLVVPDTTDDTETDGSPAEAGDEGGPLVVHSFEVKQILDCHN